MRAASWQRIGGVSGLLFVVAIIVTFFTPGTPDADDPVAEIAREVADDRTAHLLSIYVSGIAGVLFLAFLAALWTVLRRAEPEPGPSMLALLGGVATVVIIWVANGAFWALVNAADEGREPEAVRALFELDETVFIGVGFGTAAFYAGIALSALPGRTLPSWLGWSAAALAVLFLVATLGIFSEDDEGGVLGFLFFPGILLNFLWVLAASVVLLRGVGASTTGTDARSM